MAAAVLTVGIVGIVSSARGTPPQAPTGQQPPPPAPTPTGTVVLREADVPCPTLSGHSYSTADGAGGTWHGSWNAAPAILAPTVTPSLGLEAALVCTYAKTQPACSAYYKDPGCAGMASIATEPAPPCAGGTTPYQVIQCKPGGYGWSSTMGCWYAHVEGDTLSPPYGTFQCMLNGQPSGPPLKCSVPTTDAPDGSGWTTTRTFWGPFAQIPAAGNTLSCTAPFVPEWPGSGSVYAVSVQGPQPNRSCTVAPAASGQPAGFHCKYYGR
ncbi:MAG TPA: hypothetical protein VIF09_08270 [Polyangiaceae bacterium]